MSCLTYLLRVNMNAYTRVHTYVCIHVNTRVHTHADTHGCTHVYTHVYTHFYAQAPSPSDYDMVAKQYFSYNDVL